MGTAIVRSIALLLLLLLTGCTTLSVATVGTAVGIAATAVSTGADVYRLGKLHTAEMARVERVEAAVEGAIADLGLNIVSNQIDDEDDRVVRLIDDEGARITIRLDRRSPELTRVQIDVGWFGNEPTARLVLKRIRFHLEADDDEP